MGKIIFSISIEKKLFEKLEMKRGLIPRSSYVEYQLNKFLLEKQTDEEDRSNQILK